MLRGLIELKKIDNGWIKPLQYGGRFLGSGGGGNSERIISALERFLSTGKTVDLISLDEINPHGKYATAAVIGSSELTGEYFSTGYEGVTVVKRLEEITGVTLSALMPIEGVSINILYPILIAAMMNIPIIDADSMGRAFPEIQMSTFHFKKLSCNPVVLSDGKGEIYELHEHDNFLMELAMRKIISENSGIGYFSGFLSDGVTVKKVLIPHTISFSAEIGKVFMKADSYDDLLRRLILVTKNSIYGSCIELFRGTVKSIETIKKLNWSTIIISGNGSYAHEEFKILLQNENLIAFRQEKIAAMVPDIISIIDVSKLKPIYNNEISVDMEIAVIGTPAPLVLKTNKALNIVGPQCFGYKSEYKSLEELYFNYYFS
jgi:DUF917 family protein